MSRQLSSIRRPVVLKTAVAFALSSILGSVSAADLNDTNVVAATSMEEDATASKAMMVETAKKDAALPTAAKPESGAKALFQEFSGDKQLKETASQDVEQSRLWAKHVASQDVTEQEAVRLARALKTAYGEGGGDFAGWMRADVTELNPFYNIRGEVEEYEAVLTDTTTGDPMGYIMINRHRDSGVYSSMNPTGLSNSDGLGQYLKQELQPKLAGYGISILKKQYLVGPSSSYAVAVKLSGQLPADLKVVESNGWFLFSPFPVDLSVLNLQKNFSSASAQMSPENVKIILEQEALRGALLNNVSDDSVIYIERKIIISTGSALPPAKFLQNKSSSNSNAAAADSYSFAELKQWTAPFKQETRQWTTNKCEAGCAPVAAAIINEYWDRTSSYLRNLVGDANRNGGGASQTNRNETDPDVRAMIDSLRTFMGTVCTPNGGSTYTSTPTVLS